MSQMATRGNSFSREFFGHPLFFFAQTFIGGPTPPIHFLEKKKP